MSVGSVFTLGVSICFSCDYSQSLSTPQDHVCVCVVLMYNLSRYVIQSQADTHTTSRTTINH